MTIPTISRRAALIGGVAALGAGTLSRPGVSQADERPTITVAVQTIASTNTLEIAYEASNAGTRHYTNYVEPLVDTDWTGDLSTRPGLAESWRQHDERTVELTLRRGVRFHNGDMLTAEDVAFSFGPERLFGTAAQLEADPKAPRDPKWAPAALRGQALSVYPALERIEVVDERTVRLVNKVPDVTLVGRLSHRVGVVVSARAFREASSWREWAARPVGTGPYAVASYRPEVDLRLVAFDDYWGGRPPAKAIRFVQVSEAASRLNGLFSGEYDFACDIGPDQIETIERDGRFEVVGGLIMNSRIVSFDKTHPKLVDPRIRLAMSLAVDRQAIVDSLWQGRTQVPHGFQFEFFGPMFIAEWKGVGYDPQQARRLLTEAGYDGTPIPYRVMNNYYAQEVATAQILVEMWREVGLNIALSVVENSSQAQAKDGQRAMRDLSNTAFFNDPISSVPPVFGSGGLIGRTGEWRNALFDEQLRLLETSTDQAVRRSAFARILAILERDDPAAILLHQTANFTAKRKAIRWKPAKSFVMDFRATNLAVGRT